jgi:hypothetical protein
MYRLIVLMGLMLFLVACGGGGGSGSGGQSSGAVSIKCVGVFNPGAENCVSNLSTPTAAAATRSIDMGDVTHDEQIVTTVGVMNSTTQAATVYIVIVTDLACGNLTPPWTMSEGLTTIAAAQETATKIGYQCSDAPPGDYHITYTVYADKARAGVIDQVNGTFSIVASP